jgi:DNA-binding NarL/FixJ family response regulator
MRRLIACSLLAHRPEAIRCRSCKRTVKNIIHDITSRLELRNRTHAVAYAIKAGVI